MARYRSPPFSLIPSLRLQNWLRTSLPPPRYSPRRCPRHWDFLPWSASNFEHWNENVHACVSVCACVCVRPCAIGGPNAGRCSKNRFRSSQLRLASNGPWDIRVAVIAGRVPVDFRLY